MWSLVSDLWFIAVFSFGVFLVYVDDGVLEFVLFVGVDVICAIAFYNIGPLGSVSVVATSVGWQTV